MLLARRAETLNVPPGTGNVCGSPQVSVDLGRGSERFWEGFLEGFLVNCLRFAILVLGVQRLES